MALFGGLVSSSRPGRVRPEAGAGAPGPAGAQAAASALALSPGAASLPLRDAGGAPCPPGSPHRGYVEQATVTGIVGWLVDARDPHAAGVLELVAGDQVLARTRTTLHRQDIWLTDDPTVTPGFVFDAEALHEAAGQLGLPEGVPLQVRPAGETAVLAAVPLPTLAALRASLDGQDAPGGSADDSLGLTLPLALERHHRRARALVGHTWRAQESQALGFVEMMIHLDAHHAFVGGWTRRPIQHEQAAVIVANGRKQAAGLVIVEYPRDDLPAGAVAFFGVLQTPWRATSAFDQFFFFPAAERGGWLRANKPFRVGGPADAQERLQFLGGFSTDRRLPELERLRGSTDRWAPTPGRGAALGVQVGLDHVWLLPGFGAIVGGWLVSAGAALDQVQLRLGETTLALDPASLRARARPDLAAHLPALADRLDAAGFAAVLRGPLALADWAAPLLRFGLADGSELVLPVDAAQLRRIDAGFDLERLAPLLPGLEHEPWLDDFVAALATPADGGAAGALQVVEPARSQAVLLVALPRALDNLTLVLADLHRHAATLPDGVALVLLTEAAHDRERLLTWTAALRQGLGKRRLGVLRVASVAHALHRVSGVRQLTGARRFTLLGPDVMLTRAGWQRLAEPAFWAGDGLRALRVESLRHGRPECGVDAQAFGWSGAEFEPWWRRAPAFVGGFWRSHALPLAHADDGPAEARRLAPGAASGLAHRINQRLAGDAA